MAPGAGRCRAGRRSAPEFSRTFGSARGKQMEKQVIKAGVPETSGPFNLCVRYGDMLFISGLPPFDESYASALREARAKGQPIPPFPDIPFGQQVRIIMDHMKMLV